MSNRGPASLMKGKVVKTEGNTRVIGEFKREYAFLSNFYQSEFYVPILKLKVPTAEHGFQALKTKKKSERLRIVQATTAKGAKIEGRKATMRLDWERGVRLEAMRLVIHAKFTASNELGIRLTNTGVAELIESNTWHDIVWGRCFCSEHDGEGQNLLGELLMARRAALKGF